MFRFMSVLAVIFSLSLSTAYAQKPSALDNGLPTVTLCTGATDGNYYFSGLQIAAQAKGALNVVLVPTAGSMENLAKLDSGSCQAAIVQADAWGTYKAKNPTSLMNIELSTSLYPEFLHFICNTGAGLTKITGLTKDTAVLVGPNGSGSAVTWDSFVLADQKRYGVVPTYPIGGLRAVNKVKVGGPDATCMLFVTGLKAASINEANSVALTEKGSMALIATNDRDLLKLRAPGKNGALIYHDGQIPDDTYRGGLQPSSWGSNAVDTIAIESLFVVNSNYIDAHPADYDNLLRAVNHALPAIKNKVEAK